MSTDAFYLTDDVHLLDDTVSAADSLAAALKGGEKKQQASSADLEQLKKEHPLLAILSVNPNGGPVVGYANYKDTATVNSYLAMKEVAAERSSPEMGCFSVRIRSERTDF
jgi:predicted amidohydrolase YtcJ